MKALHSRLAAFALGVPMLAPAQELADHVVGLQYEVIPIVFNVEDVGGKVEGLAVTETATEVRIDLAADVLFAFDSAEIEPRAEQALREAAGVIEQHGDSRVRIGGHTDAKGADAYNLRLSEQRANAVRDWFVSEAGLQVARFETQGFGEAMPVAPNTQADGSDNPEGRQQNRRVEITVQKL